jgi:hypothetical protein
MSASDGGSVCKPWWYSGEDDVVPVDAERTATRRPADDPSPPQPEGDRADSGMDWSMLMMGAAKMVDWATERVMAPHAEHEDPAAHPQCVVCRTIVLVGDPEGLGMPAGRASTRGDAGGDDVEFDVAHEEPVAIRWIPVHDGPTAP